MTDKLTIEIDAAVAKALSGLSETAGAIHNLQATVVKANGNGAASAVVHESALKNLWLAYRTAPSAGALMRDVGAITGGVATTLSGALHNAVTKAGNSIKAHLHDGVKAAIGQLNGLDATLMNVGTSLLRSFGPLMGITAGLAIGIGIEQAIQKTIAWDDAINKVSHELNGNVQAASTWVAVAGFVGVGADQISIAFQRLSVAVIQHSSTLKDMGIAVLGADGKLRQMTDVIADLQVWFRAHRDTIEATDKATALFGRGNAAMAAVMGMTADQMRVLTEEARSLGLIVGGEQLAHWRSFDAEVKTAGFSVQALELVLGHGLMPIFSILAQAITQFVVKNLDGLIRGLAQVTAFIVGMLSALFGITFKFSEFANAIGGVSSQVNELGTANDLAGNSTTSLANATKQATEAIADQIDALREQNKLLQDQTDAQIAILQAEGAAQAYADQQLKSKQKLATDQKAIDKLRSDYNAYLLLGDLFNAQQVFDQLTAAQQTMADDQMSLDRQTSDHERQAKISALQATQKLHNDETNDLISALTKRSQAISRSADASNSALLVGAASTAAAFNNQWNSAGKLFTDGMNKAAIDAGKDMADAIKAAMAVIATLIDPSTDPKKVAAREAAWRKVGNDIGRAVMQGMVNAIGEWKDQGANAAAPWIQNAIITFFTPPARHRAGGQVAGPFGSPQLIVAEGGEHVTSNQEIGGQRKSYSGPPINATFYITESGDVEKTRRVVRTELNAIMGIA